MSLFNTSKVTSVLTCKCPHCRKGRMFKFGVLKISKLAEMYANCPNCGFNFFPELGFYYGAMYMSYGINVLLIVIIGALTELIFEPKEIFTLIIAIVIPVMICVPLTFRISRALMLYLFGKIR